MGIELNLIKNQVTEILGIDHVLMHLFIFFKYSEYIHHYSKFPGNYNI